jgi:hypothetical protein
MGVMLIMLMAFYIGLVLNTLILIDSILTIVKNKKQNGSLKRDIFNVFSSFIVIISIIMIINSLK